MTGRSGSVGFFKLYLEIEYIIYLQPQIRQKQKIDMKPCHLHLNITIAE